MGGGEGGRGAGFISMRSVKLVVDSTIIVLGGGGIVLSLSRRGAMVDRDRKC